MDTLNGSTLLGAGGGNGLHLLGTVNAATVGNTLINNGTLSGFGSVVQDHAGATVTNNGTLSANNAAGNALIIGVDAFNNAGTAQATGGGVLNLSSTVTTNSSLLSATGGGAINLTGGTTLQSSAGNTINTVGGTGITNGTFNVLGATLLGTINGTAGSSLVFNTDGRNILGAVGGAATANITLDLAATGNGYLQLLGVDTLNGSTLLGAGGGNGLHLLGTVNAATVGNTLINNGTLSGFGSVVQDHAGATVTNNGTLSANDSSGRTLVTGVDAFNNSAGATAQAMGTGILNLSSTVTTNDGLLSATGGGVINLTGGTTLQSNADGHISSLGGTVNVLGAALLGTINGTAGSSLIFNTDGRNSLNNTVVNATLDLAATGNGYLQLLGTDTLNGSTLLGAGGGNGLHLQGQVNAATAGNTLINNGTLSGFGSVVQDNAGATVTNSGLINSNTGGQTLTVGVTNLNNTGTAQATNGATLNLASTNVTNSGTVFADVGATVNVPQGLTQTAGLTQVFGTLNASEAVNGGILRGSGQIFGNVTNTGGTVQSVNYVTPTGTSSLAINGDFTQSGTGALDVFFGNDFHNLLTVTGQTTLGGTLGVFDLDSNPAAGLAAVGSKFTFLYYSGTLTPDGSTVNGFNQYFSNEVPDSNNSGLITGTNGFVYELVNDTADKQLDLQVVTAGSPVPEASTTVSFGLLLALGLGGAVVAARRKKSA